MICGGPPQRETWLPQVRQARIVTTSSYEGTAWFIGLLTGIALDWFLRAFHIFGL